ncbi:transporter [Arenibacter sp. GZD96]|uniref:transporter n=1 Tax=Aurantibrevibacter litoralis TaxID=3106030 RepID=UPI002AFF067A|nr:transporter [Arenibacter sp. GZD-96]MEA1787464.1 transporter [Arenibacter sp. GZD-96]
MHKGSLVTPHYTLYLALCMVLFSSFSLMSQYTDVINSNRPGQTVSAYAVGKNVLQAEFGVSYEKQDHDILRTDSNIWGSDLSLRYGLLFETLELIWEGTYQTQNISFLNFGESQTRTDFSRNRLGLKYLLYDPYKNPERNTPNLYSWRANNKFQWKNLIPAISVYAGATFNLGDNPFFSGDPTVSPRIMLATQSRLSPRFVLISNITYDRISSDFPEWSYIISLSHALKNPKWSVFGETQIVDSDRYSDVLFRTGTAYLISKNLQADINIAASYKDTPTRIQGTVGISYRLDMHKDVLIPIDEQEGGENGEVPRNAMKQQAKNTSKLGASKKELKRQRKKDRKKGMDENSIIEF